MTIAKAGTLLEATMGDCSDYKRIGWFVAVQDYDPDAFVQPDGNSQCKTPLCFLFLEAGG